jgi:hypothetical protein
LLQERRKYERKPSSIRVEMSHPAFGKIIGSTTDISDGGAQVHIDNDVIPPVGTVVDVIFRKIVDHINEDPVAMKVMHAGKSSVGLMFLPR